MRSPVRGVRSRALSRIDQFSILDGWARLFARLQKGVLLYHLGKRFPTIGRSYGFTDLWVVFRLVLSVFFLLLSGLPGRHPLEMLLIIIGAYSVFEALVVQVNVLVFGGYLAGKKGLKHRVKGYRRLVLTSLHNYAEIIVWFALFYRNLECCLRASQDLPINSFVVSLNFSFVTMTTFGHSDIKPTNWIGVVLTLVQATIGLLMVLLILSGFIGLLPPPFTKDKGERHEHSAMR